MSSSKANLIEIFSSIQGEAPYIGCRQLFIRFTLCNLSCSYCDTTFSLQEHCKIEEIPGSAIFNSVKNPVSVEQLVEIVNNFSNFNHHSISLTGGEPLLNSYFLSEFLPALKKNALDKNLKVYLESNGTLYEELEEVIEYIDIISMDFKLQSSTSQPTPWDKHKNFINVARSYNKEIFSKIVISSKFSQAEIDEVVDVVINAKNIPLILQPVNSSDKSLIPSSKQLLQIQEQFLTKLRDVRIIPQMHKYLNLL